MKNRVDQDKKIKDWEKQNVFPVLYYSQLLI